MSRGTRTCVIGLHREHVDAARAVLARHPAVVEGSVRHDGDRLRWQLDLGALPEGDGPAVELVITRDIHAAVRP